MANDQMAAMNDQQRYDLEERTAVFAENVVVFVKRLRLDPVTEPLVRQLVRSATSIGANYCEADEAQSKKDFRHKIAICRKESKETKYWLRILATAVPEVRDDAAILWREAKELGLIFAAIWNRTPVKD